MRGMAAGASFARGAEAESLVASLLASLPHLVVLNDRGGAGRGNIDHLAVGRGRLWMIETKSRRSAPSDATIAGWASAAVERTRRVREQLRSAGQWSVGVVPVVVVVGPARCPQEETPHTYGQADAVCRRVLVTTPPSLMRLLIRQPAPDAAFAALVSGLFPPRGRASARGLGVLS